MEVRRSRRSIPQRRRSKQSAELFLRLEVRSERATRTEIGSRRRRGRNAQGFIFEICKRRRQAIAARATGVARRTVPTLRILERLEPAPLGRRERCAPLEVGVVLAIVRMK